MATKYDAIVIGTGQAGPSVAVRLADTGMKVAIIERKRFGGTCVNNGYIPTKTLVASARAAHVGSQRETKKQASPIATKSSSKATKMSWTCNAATKRRRIS